MMSIKSKYNRLCWGVAALALIACSEWNEHYDADTSLLNSQESTLWENIEHNNQLTQFADLLRKTGYDEVLKASQTYTVWAPIDGSFDYTSLSALGNNKLQKEFVQNHIARYSYPASGPIAERVYMLNEKLMNFNGQQSYNINGVSVDQPNLASRNGVIHLLNGKIPFMANIYESLDNESFGVDSIAKFLHSYDVKELNEWKSVEGPTLNGEKTFLDSVFNEHNDQLALYQAYVNREDSNYTMIVPTNEAWNKARAKISQYFNYLPSFEFMENTSTDDKKVTNITLKDQQYLKDSIVNLMLMCDLFYNNNIYDNKKLTSLQTGQRLQCDSLYSTTMAKVYSEDAADLFEGAKRYDMSNGNIWVTDSLRMRSWTSWNPEIIIEAENSFYHASYSRVAGDPERVYVTPGTQNPEIAGRVSNNAYLEVQPVSMSANPGIVFYLPNVRSTTYSVYIVMVPATIVSTSYKAKPNCMSFTMGMANEKGKNVEVSKEWTVENNFTNDTTKVDTLYLGDVTFPMAYAGTGDYYPYLRVTSYVTSRMRDFQDRVMRIDCIILRPKELDDFLKEHPDYKYDDGTYN